MVICVDVVCHLLTILYHAFIINFFIDLGVNTSIYTKHQCKFCNGTFDSLLIENNDVTPDYSCNPFSSDSVVFNEKRITSVIASCRSVDADVWCKSTLTMIL